MECDSSATPLVIGYDVRVSSERNGAAAVTWNDPSQWGAVCGASSIEVFPLILHRESAPTLTLVAEGSSDGRTFLPINAVAERCTWDDQAEPQSTTIHLRRDEAAPIVRFGLQVENGTSVQGAVRVSLVIVVHRSTQQATHAAVSMASISGADTPVASTDPVRDTLLDATFCSSVVVRLSATSVTGTLNVELRTSDDGDTWYSLTGATISLTTTPDTDTVGLSVTAGILRYVKLFTTAGNTGSATGFNAIVWVRS